MGFPGGSVVKKKKPDGQCRRCGFDAWVRKISLEKKIVGKSHGQRSLVGYSL